jgi:hypothetical protein
MSNRTTLWVVLVTLLVAPAVGLAAQRFDRLDRYDRARLRAEIHREMRDVARERHRLREEIRRELRHAGDSYRYAWGHTARDAYREAMRETRRAMREALRSFR